MTEDKQTELRECRDAFEMWYSEGNMSCPSIRKNDLGDYRLMQAHASWAVWHHCWRQRQARIEKLEAALREIGNSETGYEDEQSNRIIKIANLALEDK